eukprot:m.75458 g.75458  ORF g.75458 m.75458 type:complete len:88 (+) comp8483_c0_seq2:256-519(+)
MYPPRHSVRIRLHTTLFSTQFKKSNSNRNSNNLITTNALLSYADKSNCYQRDNHQHRNHNFDNQSPSFVPYGGGEIVEANHHAIKNI